MGRHSRKNRWMEGPFPWPVEIIGSYILIVILAFTIMLDLGEPPNVPAVAAPDDEQPQGEGNYEVVLRRGMPVLSGSGDESLGFSEVLQSIFHTLTGVRLREPETFLYNQLPQMASILPLREGTLGGQDMPPGVLVRPHTDLGALEPGELIRPAAPRFEGISGEPLIAIYHTHTQESFLSEMPAAAGLEPADAYTSDSNRSIVRVGRVLAEELQNRYGIGVVHSTKDHSPHTGSYGRSRETLKQIFKEYPGIQMVFDVHRDAEPRDKTTVNIGGEQVARVMFVVGTGQLVSQPNWRENYEFALGLAEMANRLYPGFSRGVMPKPYAYNQDLYGRSVIIEIGGYDNTMDEEERAAVYLAEVLAHYLTGLIGEAALDESGGSQPHEDGSGEDRLEDGTNA